MPIMTNDIPRKEKFQLLKEWDISFKINAEVFGNILRFFYGNQDGYKTDIKSKDSIKQVPILFYANRVCINQKSDDNVRFAHVTIDSKDLMDYDPSLEKEKEKEKNKGSRCLFKGLEEDFKGVIVDLKITLDELIFFEAKDDFVEVRINTIRGRIEFHLQGNVVVWATLVRCKQEDFLEHLPGIIKRVRSTIKATVVVMELFTFTRLCKLGGYYKFKVASNRREARKEDERILIAVDEKEGLTATSGDKVLGRFLTVQNPEAYIDDMLNMDLEEWFMQGNDKILTMEADPNNLYIYIKQEFMLPFLRLDSDNVTPITLEIRHAKPLVIEQFPFSGIRAILSIAPRIEFGEKD
jgi:hypothetical protein